jgi:hypothetical protein
MFGLSLYYLSQYNVIKYNNFTNFTGTGAAACLGCGGSNAHSVIENRFHDNYINGTYYGIKWDDSYQNNTAYNNEIYHTSLYALMFDPDNYEQNVYNNTICYNKYAMVFSTGRNFENVKIHNNSFCILGLDPMNGSHISDRTPLLNFNATNILNQSATNCSALIGGTDSGTNATLGADNSNQTLQVNWTLSRGWYELNYTCRGTYDDTAVPNTLDFYITNADPTHSNPWIGTHQPAGSYADDSLVSYWQFEHEGNKTGVAVDKMVLNNGTLNGGVTFTDEGRIGSAYEFDGDGDHIALSSDITMSTDNWTINAWVNPASFTITQNIMSGDVVANSACRYISLYITTGKLAFWDNGASLWRQSDTGTTLDEWNMVTFNYNGSEVLFYLNGVADGSGVLGSAYSDCSINYIGMFSDGSTRDFNGSIDEAMIFNRSISASEIREIYLDGHINDSSTVTTDQDLAVASNNTADDDADDTVKIFNWYRNGTSITVLNMPFETNTSSNDTDKIRDYSPYENNGTLGAGDISQVPTWTDQGRNGSTGAYDFDGTDDYINLTDQPFDIYDDFSVSFWAKMDAESDYAFVASKATGSGSNSGWFIQSRAANNQDRWQVDVYNSGWKQISTSIGWDTTYWHHVAFTYGSNLVRLYVDGEERNSTSVSGSITANDIPLKIGGTHLGGNYNFNGKMDEVRIYNRSLTPEQIKAHYNLEYNRIVSNETLSGENWSATVTPNDNQDYSDGPTYFTENVTIKNSDPTVTLYSPTDGNDTLFNRNVTLLWNGTDSDGDTLTYEINLTVNGGGCTNYSWSGIPDENYTTPTLCVDEVYYWAVRASDGTATGSFSSTFNFTVPSTIIVSLITQNASFGNLYNDDSNDTLNNNPPAIEVRNDGNIYIDLKIYATDPMWDSVTLNTSYFMFMAGNSTSESGSHNGSAPETATAWKYINGTEVTASEYVAGGLNWSNVSDQVEIELNITVPHTEHSGVKNATLVIIGEAT